MVYVLSITTMGRRPPYIEAPFGFACVSCTRLSSHFPMPGELTDCIAPTFSIKTCMPNVKQQHFLFHAKIYTKSNNLFACRKQHRNIGASTRRQTQTRNVKHSKITANRWTERKSLHSISLKRNINVKY